MYLSSGPGAAEKPWGEGARIAAPPCAAARNGTRGQRLRGPLDSLDASIRKKFPLDLVHFITAARRMQGFFYMALYMENMAMYTAMTMKPAMTARPTSSAGSSLARAAAMAVSSSES